MLLGDAVAFGAQKYGPRPAVIFEQQVSSFAELLECTICAVVIPRAGSAVSEAAIVDLCRQHLAWFKKPPRVRIADELPENASGKVLRRQLREQWSLADSAL